MGKSRRERTAKTNTRRSTSKKTNQPSGHDNTSLTKLEQAVQKNPACVRSAIDLAAYYLRNKQEERVLEVVKTIMDKPGATDVERAELRRLTAFGYAHKDQLLNAETACRKGLEKDPQGLDYHYVLAFVNLSLRHYEEAAQYGEIYVGRYYELSPEDSPVTEFSHSPAHLSQVHNIIGSAFYERQQAAEAEKHFRLAIDHDSGNNLPYLNLARLLGRSGDKTAARKVIEQGLTTAREVHDLKLMAQSLKESATISACMMVKNEEELLPGCLDSIRDWVDEIIVVDTGSTDRTIEIAESYGAKIFNQPWEGNFSKHRNYSTSLASCDWIFIIDADERFDAKDVPLLKQTIDSGDFQVVSVNVFNKYGSVEHKITSVNSTRFFRRDLNLQYEGIVHNSLKVPEGTRIARAPFAMEHLGYDLSPEKMKAKLERTHTLLLKQIEEDPGYAFAWFNLAQLYRGRVIEDQDLYGPKVIEAAQRVIALAPPDEPERDHFYVMAHDQIAWMKYLTGQFDEAEVLTRRALELKEDYLDPLMLLGHILAAQKKLPEALEAYEKYLEAQKNYNANFEIDAYILYHPESQATAYSGMGCVYELMDDREMAKEHYRQALDFSPQHLEANLLLGRMALEDGDLNEAGSHFQRLLDGDEPNSRAAVGMACVHLQRKDYERASKLFEQAISLDPEDPTARVKAAEFYQRVGQLGRASDLFELQLTYDTGDVEALHGLAAIHYAQEEYKRAAERYRTLIEQPGQAERPDILNDLGNCLYRSGAFEQAEEQYRKATQLADVPSISYRNLGLVYVRLDRADEALAALAEYRELEPDDHEIICLMADLLAQAGQTQEALGEYEQYLTRNPNSVLALFGLSECYFRLGHADSAIVGYRRAAAMNPDFAPAQKRLAELGMLAQPVAEG
jgi:tetratricopeptide (TPR) repeat protein